MRRIRARRRRRIAVAVIATALAALASPALGDDKPQGGSVQMPQNPPKVRQIPGGPIMAKEPDLIVEKIDAAFGQNLCNGYHAGIMPVTVTIKNVGFAAAVMPGTWKPPWVRVWSTIGSPDWAQLLGGNFAQLDSGKTTSFTAKLQVMAQIAPDKKSGSIGIEAQVDPQSTIAELNEDNNSKHLDIGLGGEYCPSGK